MKKLILLLFAVALFACEGEVTPEDYKENVSIDAFAANPQNEFIYWTDGAREYFFPLEDEAPGFSNTYLTQGDSDQLNILMKPESTSAFVSQIYISQADLLVQEYPYIMPGNGNGRAELQLLNRAEDVPVQFGSDDDKNFVGTTTNSQFRLTVTSFTDGLIQGTFRGTISTRTGSEIPVQDGRFRIRITID